MSHTPIPFDSHINHQIPKSTFDALYKLKEKGIKLFIATGRGKDGLDVLNDFPFDGYIPMIGISYFFLIKATAALVAVLQAMTIALQS